MPISKMRTKRLWTPHAGIARLITRNELNTLNLNTFLNFFNSPINHQIDELFKGSADRKFILETARKAVYCTASLCHTVITLDSEMSYYYKELNQNGTDYAVFIPFCDSLLCRRECYEFFIRVSQRIDDEVRGASNVRPM